MLIRGLQPEDSDALWQIRNSEPVRAFSNDPTPIPRDRHDAWFVRYLANPENHCEVLEENGLVVGYCRVDAALVSIALRPEAQGRGFGRALLRTAITHTQGRWPRLIAEVRHGNEVSLRLFLG